MNRSDILAEQVLRTIYGELGTTLEMLHNHQATLIEYDDGIADELGVGAGDMIESAMMDIADCISGIQDRQ